MDRVTMFRKLLRSKIHRATVTATHLESEGSLTIDEDLMEAAAILPYEAIICSNVNNGERFTTYAIGGRPGSGEIVLNGPTARKAAVGDLIIIFCYEYYSEDEIQHHAPKIVRVSKHNQILELNQCRSHPVQGILGGPTRSPEVNGVRCDN